jgi:hypothetical protein
MVLQSSAAPTAGRANQQGSRAALISLLTAAFALVITTAPGFLMALWERRRQKEQGRGRTPAHQ